MEKLIEVDQQEVLLDFHLGVKCRADVHLRSLHPTSAVAFKVQTSSPHKFLVNPPNGLLPPLSSASFQVILRPQPHVPSSFPRSPSDRFLIKAALAPDLLLLNPLPSSSSSSSLSSSHINAWFSARPHLGTQDIKLKVVYVGLFLLKEAVAASDVEAVRHILRRQKPLIPSLSQADAATLMRAASACHDPSMLSLLLESGLSMDPIEPQLPTAKAKEVAVGGRPLKGVESSGGSKGWTAIHAAAASGSYDALVQMIEEGGGGGEEELDCRDADGRTPLHLATSKGYMRCVRALVERGADRNARSKDGRTALHRAAANGDQEMVALLLDMGADPGVATARGRTPLDVARDKGHKEVVEILERGEMVLTAARRGDLKRLESLLKKGVGTNSHDQYGMTALHSAAIKGHRDIVCLLVEFGTDLECQDVEGHTPLHLGVEGGSLEIVEVLVDMGANVNAKSKRGATPLYMAKSMGYEDISQLLVSRGASCSSMASSSSSLSSTSYN